MKSMKEIQRIICFAAMLGIALSKPSNWEDEFSEDDGDSGSKATNCSCGWTNKGRIVGGQETLPNEFPLMAGLVHLETKNLFCGASIITDRHALTAVHCTFPFIDQPLHLAVGGHKMFSGESDGTTLYEIEQIFEHEDYHEVTLANDIALLVVSEKIKFSQKIGPVCLPNKMLNLVDDYVKVLGWGRNSAEIYKMSTVLMKVNLKVVPTNDCYQVFKIDIGSPNAKNVLCTYGDKKDSCEGDSGGPVIWLDPETNRFTLVGIVSHGRICGGDTPAINVNIGYFLPWIQEMISLSAYPEKTCSKETRG